MKKSLLLLTAALMAGAGLNAAEPIIAPNCTFSVLSPNSQWVVGQNAYAGWIELYSFEKNELYYYPDIDEDPEAVVDRYTLGLGNCLSNNGIVVISDKETGKSLYIENNTIKELPSPEGVILTIANAITPDGSRIAGTSGMEMDLNAQQVMQTPVVWNRLESGEYSEPVKLPYPTKDFTGRLPQYVLIDCISQDGKTLTGQVIDYFGTWPQPIIYTEDSEGQWSYQLIGDEMLNPNQVVFPEYPGEYPEVDDFLSDDERKAYETAKLYADLAIEPEVTDFMHPDSLAKYNAALEESMNTGEFVWYGNYMTEEQAEAYNDAMTAYYAQKYPDPQNYASEATMEKFNAYMVEWEPKMEAFNEAFYEVAPLAAAFEMNISLVSPNANFLATAANITDTLTWNSQEYVMLFNRVDGTWSSYTNDSVWIVLPTYVSNTGDMIVAKPALFGDLKTYSYMGNTTKGFLTLQDAVKAKNPETYDWMKANMFHSYLEYNWMTEEDEEKELWYTGTATTNPDMDFIVTYAFNEWDLESEYVMYTYMFPVTSPTAIETPEAAAQLSLVSADAQGNLYVNGEVSALSVYDMSGRCVFSVENPASCVNTGLGRGAYLVNAQGAKGVQTLKVLF